MNTIFYLNEKEKRSIIQLAPQYFHLQLQFVQLFALQLIVQLNVEAFQLDQSKALLLLIV